jgi:hypothetical protein
LSLTPLPFGVEGFSTEAVRFFVYLSRCKKLKLGVAIYCVLRHHTGVLGGYKNKGSRKDKIMAGNKNGLNETVLGWFKRVHPKELWAVNDMPQTITFDDVRKSMESGFGMGEVELHSDTATRELILRHTAEVVGMKIEDLISWSDRHFLDRCRAEYKANHTITKKPDIKKIRVLMRAVNNAVKELGIELKDVDCVMLADKLEKDGIFVMKDSCRRASSDLSDAEGVFAQALGFL